MEKVEWEDVQGLVLSGYPKLNYSAFVLWRFLPGQNAAARLWLAGLAGRLMRSGTVDGDEVADAAGAAPSQPAPATSLKAMKKPGAVDVWAINLALTARGLKQLGVSGPELAMFSNEFLEGMAPEAKVPHAVPRRSNLLGDVGDNSPECWHWGGSKANREIDGVLLLYAANDTSLQTLVEAEMKAMAAAAAPVVPASPHDGGPLILKGRAFCDGKEHFGFKDGISQPKIEGSQEADKTNRENPKQARISIVKPGEFVLGYLNERKARVSFSNAAAPGAPSSKAGQARSRNLGRNGTYLVFRQLEQDVRAFNKFVSKAAERVHGTADAAVQDWVASRLIGRTRDGEPLVGPDADSPSGPDPRNDFLYHFEDRFGLACPIGAHIRRANPRDTMGPDPDTALRLSKMHRIIRRGRPYGERLSQGDGAGAKDGEEKPRGIYFICLNADIAGQFEMIQHSWLNNVHFSGLYAGTDPLSHFRAGGDVMTIQRRPTNLHIDGLQPFVKVRGGAYFFLPGITALRSLAQ